MKALPNLRTNLLCLSVIYIAIGVVLLVFPQISLAMLCGAIGAAAIIFGVVNVAVYFIRKGFLNPNQLGFSIGVAALLFGLFAVLRTDDFKLGFAQILALCMIADSIVKLQFSMDLLRLQNKLWWVSLALACVTAGLSMAILLVPFSNGAVKDTYTYIVLIADGVVNILTTAYLSFALKRFAKPVAAPEEAAPEE